MLISGFGKLGHAAILAEPSARARLRCAATSKTPTSLRALENARLRRQTRFGKAKLLVRPEAHAASGVRIRALLPRGGAN
jgi:hypothetical protein